MGRRYLLAGVILLHISAAGGLGAQNWYEKSFYLLHEDHHTRDVHAVGRDADPAEVRRLIGLSRPDVIQMHAKGNPGWTTYPSKIGHTPPKLARDVLAVWRDIARRDGYRFSVYYNIGRDGEIMKRRPEWNRAKPDGQLFERALCYHSGVAENYLWPMIDEIMERYDPDGFWFDGSCFTVTTCYCTKCQNRFRREWGAEVPYTLKEEGWREFKAMHRQIYREFVRDTARRIKKRKPDCLVAFNFAYSLRMPEAPDPGVDYLTGDFGNEVEALSCEAHWYDGQNRPFDLMTTVYLNDGTGIEPKPAGQIRQEMAVIIANGGRYFAWDAPSATSGLNEQCHQSLGKVAAPFLRERQKWCLETERLPDVSVLHTATNHYAREYRTRQCFPRPRAFYEGTETLCRAHLNYEIVSEERLHRLDIRSPLLIVDSFERFAAKDAQALERYIGEGGQVLMTGAGSAFERLSDVFGVDQIEAPGAPENLIVTLDSRPITMRRALCRIRATGAEVVVSAMDAKAGAYPVLTSHTYGKGWAWFLAVPLLTPPQEGAFPREFLSAVFETVLPTRNRLVATNAPETVEIVLRRQGDRRRIIHLVNRDKGKRTVVREQWGRPYYRITDIARVSPCRVSVRLPSKPAAVTLQPQDTAIPGWSFRNGRLEVDLPEFHIHQMLAIEQRGEDE